MNKKIIPFLLLGIVLLLAVAFFSRPHNAHAPEVGIPVVATTGTVDVFDQHVSDGTITFGYSSKEFGLATTPEQILVHPYIPPCDTDFTYCIYFNNDTYKGTNFESAGLRIQKRTDLATSQKCLETPPEGYAEFAPSRATSINFMTSIFAPLGNGAAGHYAIGALYRLSYRNLCYEFETRIGVAQYANYPEGAIKKFTDADQESLETKLRAMLESIVLSSGEKVYFWK